MQFNSFHYTEPFCAINTSYLYLFDHFFRNFFVFLLYQITFVALNAVMSGVTPLKWSLQGDFISHNAARGIHFIFRDIFFITRDIFYISGDLFYTSRDIFYISGDIFYTSQDVFYILGSIFYILGDIFYIFAHYAA